MHFLLPLILSAIVFIVFFRVALFVNSHFDGKYLHLVIGYVFISFIMNSFLFLEKDFYLNWYEGPLYQFIAILASLTLLYMRNTTFIYGAIVTVMTSMLCFKLFGLENRYLFIGVCIGHIFTKALELFTKNISFHQVQFEDFEKIYLQGNKRE